MKRIVKEIIKKSPLYPLAKLLKDQYTHKRMLENLKERDNEKNTFKKPGVINLNANDICNSKCVMCNIWQQKQEFEYTPEQLKEILSDPLYSEVVNVGITGGEPTLREDLSQLYLAAIKALPNLKGLSIITNAIKKDAVIERIDEVINVVRENNKHFSMMVSLDGFGKVHDEVRGREGNFESALSVIHYFKNKGINVEIGCTISKVNLWEVEEFLAFLKRENIYGRFRLAEFIKRLYNEDKEEIIRNFTKDERYFLTLFFYKLIFTFEKNPIYKRTYYSIIEMLNGNKRLIGCPYQEAGVNLNSRGEIAYCAPKSPVIGSSISKSSIELFKDNLNVRQQILLNDCENCVHDYHAPITLNEYLKQRESDLWRRKININNSSTITYNGIGPSELTNVKSKVGFIVGWYGTETVGDKAILAGIIDDFKNKYGHDSLIIIASLYPYITFQTVRELNIEAKVIDVYSQDFPKYARYADYTIMGGGPLMDIDDLAVPLHAFRTAKKYSKETIVYGCGLGPLTKPKYLKAVVEILKLSSIIMLRDNGSISFAKQLGFHNPTLSGDYAKHYLNVQYPKVQNHTSNGIIACFLREWTHEYAPKLSANEFQKKKDDFELGIANLIKSKVKEIGAQKVVLYHMHNFVVGGDDRDFSRYFINKYFSDYEDALITFDKNLSTVDSTVIAMQNADLNICMRFHSVLFAHTLSTNFVAIDYTLGGKIHHYLSDNKELSRLMTVDDLIPVA